jgi:hypothetical protein
VVTDHDVSTSLASRKPSAASVAFEKELKHRIRVIAFMVPTPFYF